MKIAISSMDKTQSAQMDSRFGRCAYFVVYDTDTEKFDVFENPAVSASGGAGPAAAQELSKNNIDVVITGHVGGNAAQALNAAKIKFVTDVSGTVQEVLDAFLQNQKTE